MCLDCGCDQTENTVTLTLLNETGQSSELDKQVHYHMDLSGNQEIEHSHNHGQGHNHHHHSIDSDLKKISVEHDILTKNHLLAERNRGYFEAKNINALNIISSPGSGKTCLLERTILLAKNKLNLYIIEGDPQTQNDANRIKAAGAPVIQINTGNGCHLDSTMINKAVKNLEIIDNSILIIENVGNLVCPSLFDLGEKHRIVMMSVTEGDDKPLKYPAAFQNADVCIISKIDLLPYVDFSVETAKKYASQINPGIKFFELSTKTNEGMESWMEWLQKSL